MCQGREDTIDICRFLCTYLYLEVCTELVALGNLVFFERKYRCFNHVGTFSNNKIPTHVKVATHNESKNKSIRKVSIDAEVGNTIELDHHRDRTT